MGHPSGGTLYVGLFLGCGVTLGVVKQYSRWVVWRGADHWPFAPRGRVSASAGALSELGRDALSQALTTRGLAVALLSQGRDLFPQGLDFIQDCRAFFMAIFFRFVHFLH